MGQVGLAQVGLYIRWDRMGLGQGGLQIRWDRMGLGQVGLQIRWDEGTGTRPDYVLTKTMSGHLGKKLHGNREIAGE